MRTCEICKNKEKKAEYTPLSAKTSGLYWWCYECLSFCDDTYGVQPMVRVLTEAKP